MMVTLHSYAQWILRPLGYVKKASANENSLRLVDELHVSHLAAHRGLACAHEPDQRQVAD